jgi:quinol monooxygenase YgiN
MIAVLGVVEAEEGELSKLHTALTTMVVATQAEAGCLQYVFATDITNPNRLLISELWQDEGALAAHFATPHMATFNAAIAGARLKKVNVKRHDIANTSQLMGGD